MHPIPLRASAAGLNLSLILILALQSPWAAAQTAADGKLQSLGNAGAKAPIMSREELRACLNEQAGLKTRSQELASQRAALDAERKQLEADNDALKQRRDEMAAKAERLANELNIQVAAHTETVTKFNAKMDALNVAMKNNESNVDRRRTLLEREGAQIQKTSDELNARNVAAQAEIDAAQVSLKAGLADFQAHIDDWNARNKKMEPAADAYDDQLGAWKSRCGGRNYRESDERAIRAGK